MDHVDEILLDFQRADEERQLYLFLAHRRLRPRFMAILQNGVKQDAAESAGKRLFGMLKCCRQWSWRKSLGVGSDGKPVLPRV